MLSTWSKATDICAIEQTVAADRRENAAPAERQRWAVIVSGGTESRHSQCKFLQVTLRYAIQAPFLPLATNR